MRAVWLLTMKDLRTLVRSRVMLVLLLLGYSVAIALVLGLLLSGATRSATIALVNEDGSDAELRIGDRTFGLDQYRETSEKQGVTIIDMDREEALHALDEGQVAGVVVIPERFFARLSTFLSPGELELFTGDSPLGDAIAERIRGGIFGLNLTISNALVTENLSYLETIVEGGEVQLVDQEIAMLGLKPSVENLEAARESLTDPGDIEKIDEVIEFATAAQEGLPLAEKALQAIAAPIRLDHVPREGKSPLLTARLLSIALAISIAFVCVMLIAASLAAERDEHVLGRLIRGLVHGWQLIASKLLLGMFLALASSTVIFLIFAVLAPQAWSRFPLLLAGIAIAALAFSAIGTLIATVAGDARTATLAGLLLVLPMAPLSLVPGNAWVDRAAAILPFEHAQELFNTILFENDPWNAVLVHVGALALITAVTGLASLGLLRRLA